MNERNLMMQNNEIVPVVHVKDGQVFANSKDVADYFGKNHRDVLTDIRRIIEGAKISAAWFVPTVHTVTRLGRGSVDYPAFDMTRDGFTLLVMGYTGKKAMEFKVAYIQRFNEMEAALKAQAEQQYRIPQTYSEALALAAEQAKRIEDQQVHITAQEQTINGLTDIVGKHVHTLPRFARTITGLNSLQIKRDLLRLGYLYRRGGAYRAYRRYEHLFPEKFDEMYGSIEIMVTKTGKRRIAELYMAGLLTMKKGFLPHSAEGERIIAENA